MKTTRRNFFFFSLLSIVLFLCGCSKGKESALDANYEMTRLPSEVLDEPDPETTTVRNAINFTSPELADERQRAIDFMTTKAANSENDGEKKFIRTVQLNLIVEDVVKATHAIENVIIGKKGFIISSVVNNEEYYSSEVKVNKDSVLVSSYNRYIGNLELRVHYSSLDEALRQIALCAQKVIYRNVNAEEVTFSILANKLAQERKTDKTQRLKNISGANKGHKLEDLLDAEEAIDKTRESADNSKVEELKMYDRIEYSAITITLQQEPVITKKMKYVEPEVEAYRSNFFWKTFNAIKTGWDGLLEVIIGLFYIWPIVLIVGSIVVTVWYFRRRKRKS